jgi:hypothetical protein
VNGYKDSKGNYLDIIDIIGQFERATQNMGSAERSAAMSTIFGSRSVASMNILMDEGSDKLRAYRTDLENAVGARRNYSKCDTGINQKQDRGIKKRINRIRIQVCRIVPREGRGTY